MACHRALTRIALPKLTLNFCSPHTGSDRGVNVDSGSSQIDSAASDHSSGGPGSAVKKEHAQKQGDRDTFALDLSDAVFQNMCVLLLEENGQKISW